MFNIRKRPKKKSILKPYILSSPNIPKPLHGLTPKLLLGENWWKNEKKIAKNRTKETCSACGITKQNAKIYKWLELHGYYTFNNSNGILTIHSFEPLCHYCHSFIHSGLLTHKYNTKRIDINRYKAILQHGIEILNKNTLDIFGYTKLMCENMNINTYNLKSIFSNTNLKWSNYRLLLNNKEYKPIFKSFDDWKQYYIKKDK